MTERRKKRLGIFGALFAIAICVFLFHLFAGNARRNNNTEQEEPITLTLVYAYQNAQWNQGIQTIVEKFQQEYDNIIIDTQIQYEDQVYEDALGKLQARDNLGDIIQMKVPGRYAKEGLLTPIDESVGNLVEDTYVYQDEIYGVPAIGSTNGILYNKGLFEQYNLSVPTTYDEFLALCQTIKNTGITPVGVAGGDLWHMEFWVNHFFRTDVLSKNEAWLVECEQGQRSWQEPEPIAMLTHLQQLFTSGYVNEDWLVKRDGNLTYSMSQGEVAMIYTGSWNARELEKLNPQMELGWFYLPNEEGEITVSQNQDVFWSLTKACGEDGEKYQAALCFLNFFYQDDIYISLCQATYGFPVTAEKPEYEETQIQLEMKEQFCTNDLHVTDYIGNEDTPEGFEKSLLYQIQELAKGTTEVSQAAVRLDELWQAYGTQEDAP